MIRWTSVKYAHNVKRYLKEGGLERKSKIKIPNNNHRFSLSQNM